MTKSLLFHHQIRSKVRDNCSDVKVAHRKLGFQVCSDLALAKTVHLAPRCSVGAWTLGYLHGHVFVTALLPVQSICREAKLVSNASLNVESLHQPASTIQVT